MKKILTLLAAFTILVGMTACGSKPAVETQSETKQTATSSLESTSEQTEDPMAQITEARNWLVGDVWNPMTSVRDYYETGKGSSGEEIDPEFLIAQLTKAMEKKAGYDKQMSELPAEFDELKSYWGKASEQIDIFWAYIQEHPLEVTGETFNTDLFSQYFQAFDDLYYELDNA